MPVCNVKGTHDIFGEESGAFQAVEGLMRQVADLFSFNEIRPPVLEHTELFVRSVGESSDVVRKEMYTFNDKGDRSLTLRPEFTAGIVRLLIQNKLLFTSELPYKAYYLGPVFRYERPQLGRYRQFHQFGVEAVGSKNPLVDVEVIALAYTILNSLGLNNVVIKINTLGDEESRNNYKTALKEFFGKHIEEMCPDCKSRYELNPLRILDCKVPEDQEIVKDAPKMSQYLSKEANERFSFILDALDQMNIPYEVDDTLVRGLDYYSDTVFEFHYTSAKGNNYGAVGAGGHYDRLVKELGGPDLPGVGFSFGVERVVSILKDDNLLPENLGESCEIYVMPVGEKAQMTAEMAANILRMEGYITDICFDTTKLGNMFKRAEKKHARVAVIIGEEEMNNNKVIIKDLEKQEQVTVEQSELVSTIENILRGEDDCCSCHDDCCSGHHHSEGECHCHDDGKCHCHHDEDEEENEEECCCCCHGHHHED